MERFKEYSDQYLQMAMGYAPRILGAILVLIIGLWVISLVDRLITRSLQRREMDVSLRSFLGSLVSVVLKLLLIITVAGMIGIQTSSFIALLAAAGLAVGLALQGSLANFAGGVLIMFFRPFRVGDLVESGGQFGQVTEIQIFNTLLLTPENKTAILPNGAVSNGTILNFSRHGNLRVDITVAVAPDSDVVKVRQMIENIFAADTKVLKNPAPSVNVLSISDNMITLAVRPYAIPADYWDIFFGIQEKIKIAFEQNNISAPIPHRVIINKTNPSLSHSSKE